MIVRGGEFIVCQRIAHFIDEFAIANERRTNRLTGAAGEATIKVCRYARVGCQPTFHQAQRKADAPARAVRFIER